MIVLLAGVLPAMLVHAQEPPGVLPNPTWLKITTYEGGASALVEWDEVSNAILNGYSLQFFVNGVKTVITNTDASTTSHGVSLDGVEQLRVRLRAWGYDAGEIYRSSWVETDWIPMPSAFSMSEPTNLQIVISGDEDIVVVRWNEIDHPNLDGYTLQYSLDGSQKSDMNLSTSMTSYTIPLGGADRLQVRVRGWGYVTPDPLTEDSSQPEDSSRQVKSYQSAWASAEWNRKTADTSDSSGDDGPASLPTPSNLWITANEDLEIASMSWEGISHHMLDAYSVQFYLNGAQKPDLNANVSMTLYNAIALVGVNELWVRVRAWGYDMVGRPYRSSWIEARWHRVSVKDTA